MAATISETSFQEVLEKMEELAEPGGPPQWEDLLASMPGPEKTGELGFVVDDDDDDEED